MKINNILHYYDGRSLTKAEKTICYNILPFIKRLFYHILIILLVLIDLFLALVCLYMLTIFIKSILFIT